MDVNMQVEIVMGIIKTAIDDKNEEFVKVNMDWDADTDLSEIIDFNDILRSDGYETSYEIYGDEYREPYVIATIRKMKD